MVGNVAFLMKDLVLLAVSFYLLKQDVVTAAASISEVAEQEMVSLAVRRLSSSGWASIAQLSMLGGSGAPERARL